MSFWGLVVEANKLYSQTVPMPYRVTMAALGADSASTGKSAPTRTSVVLVVDNKDEYVICNLTPGKNDQQNLDLVLQAGAEIAFKVTGERPATVYLTGYYMEEQQPSEDEHEECDDEECDSEMEGFIDDEAIEDEEDEDEEDEAEFTDELSEEDFSDDDEEDEDEDEEEFDSEEEKELRIKQIESESEQEEKPAQKKRAAKEEETQAAAKKNKTVEKPIQPTPEDSKTQSPKKQQQEKAAAPPTPPTNNGQLVKKTLPNGLQIEDISLGEGPKAKKGRKVGITYKGTLANGKVFDESKGNDILRFTLGKGEVVKGMDLGVEGMALGGVRRLTIPASLGYGNKSAGKIPANSTLIFEVKLAQVNTQQ